jgi:rRNA-processing protein FCF1
MKIVINDANILIDLAKLELLNEFSELDFEMYTTDFVFEELNAEQKSPINKLIESESLNLIQTEELEDYQGITQLLNSSTGLSFEDCSVWYYSQKFNGTLLTGDGKLRKEVKKNGIEVRGIIYLFDELLKQNKIDFERAIIKIEELKLLNNRLPKKEIDKRIELWKNKECVG